MKEGYRLNPDSDIRDAVLQRLAKNRKEYGKPYCPCKFDRSDDNVCPCREHREQADDRPCHCYLYVPADWAAV